MWTEIAAPEQAKLMVEKYYKDTTNLKSPYGIRTLSKKEKMYYVVLQATLHPGWVQYGLSLTI